MALAGVFLIGLLLRVRYAVGNDSIVFPDEFHQSTEQAHRLVYGYGLIPWEFDRGARTWVWPALLAGPLEVAQLLGMSDRVVVMHEGHLAGELAGAALTEEAVMRLATGGEAG